MRKCRRTDGQTSCPVTSAFRFTSLAFGEAFFCPDWLLWIDDARLHSAGAVEGHTAVPADLAPWRVQARLAYIELLEAALRPCVARRWPPVERRQSAQSRPRVCSNAASER